MSLNWQSPAYIERPRLLEALPNEVGYVIWLQAPAGFGKSVLAGQLASRLGWPTYWASSLLGDPKDQLARALGLPNQVPWAAITEALAEKPCLVVLEDLNGDEKLSPLLRASPALLLLASRENLPYPELTKLRAEGRLLHLGAAELAFTREEARTLFAGREDWESAYLACGGWPLPLFLAYFTREQPDAPSLLRGLRDSLSSAAFREALLMSALPYLPLELARAETFELFEKGLLRRIPQGFQLHSLMKDIALQRLKSELQVVVLAEQGRLPDELRAEALWHAELREHLIELLEEPRDLAILPEKLVAWRDFLRQGGPRTQLRLGEALLQTGRLEGFDLLRPLANHHEKTLAVIAMGHLIYFAVEPMLKTDGAEQEAQAYLERGRALLGQVKKELAGRFLNDAARFYFERGQPRDAEKMLHEALSYLPPESPYRVAALNNLSLLRFELYGDLLQRIQTLEEVIPQLVGGMQINRPGSLRDLGRLYLLLGENEKARRAFQEACSTPGSPLASLEAQIFLAYMERDVQALSRLATKAELWESSYLAGRARAFWALLSGDPRVLEGYSGFLPSLARAELHGDINLLPAYPQSREERLHWHATRYRICREVADLEALHNLTLSRMAVLPGLLPLESLPADRPELTLYYPVRTVLNSGWKEAIRLRLPELPPLKARILGHFELEGPLGPLSLEGRRREIVGLFMLGLSRSEVAFALWPELSEEAARNNLGVWLNRLRRELEPWGVPTYIGDGGLVRVESDLAQLEEALAAEQAERVLELYREPLLPGIYLEPVEERRRGLRWAVQRLFIKQDEPRYLKRLLELDPLDQEALERLIELFLRKGQKVIARNYLKHHLRRMEEELGEPPPLGLRRLMKMLE